jgi:hypothetical protein
MDRAVNREAGRVDIRRAVQSLIAIEVDFHQAGRRDF